VVAAQQLQELLACLCVCVCVCVCVCGLWSLKRIHVRAHTHTHTRFSSNAQASQNDSESEIHSCIHECMHTYTSSSPKTELESFHLVHVYVCMIVLTTCLFVVPFPSMPCEFKYANMFVCARVHACVRRTRARARESSRFMRTSHCSKVCMNECMYVCMHGITGATSSTAFFLAASTTLSDQSTPASTVMRHAPAPPCRARWLGGSALRKKCGVGQSEHEHVAEEQALGDKTPALANALPSTAAARKTRSHRREAMVHKK
jgi:hypothetical protein